MASIWVLAAAGLGEHVGQHRVIESEGAVGEPERGECLGLAAGHRLDEAARIVAVLLEVGAPLGAQQLLVLLGERVDAGEVGVGGELVELRLLAHVGIDLFLGGAGLEEQRRVALDALLVGVVPRRVGRELELVGLGLLGAADLGQELGHLLRLGVLVRDHHALVQ
jgi:hypothetical protein